MVDVKICGITDALALDTAAEYGASYIGFVFYPDSPRFVSPKTAAELCDFLPRGVARVGVFVNPDDKWLQRVLADIRLDYIQLHGTETPSRVDYIRQDWGLPVIKAFGVKSLSDIDVCEPYLDVADMVLFDAKAPKNASRPGGNAISFDWKILYQHPLLEGQSWILAGGIDKNNVYQAVSESGASIIDVSSGVEDRPGVKN